MEEKNVGPLGAMGPSSDIPAPISRCDYTEIVAHALGDYASAIPVAGAFITATKNIALNVVAVKQKNRIIHVLEELNSRVADVEKALEAQSANDGFLVLFYRLLYWVRDEVSQDKTEAFIHFGKRLLAGGTPYDATSAALNSLVEISEHELKLLVAISSYPSTGGFIARIAFVEDKQMQSVIGTTSKDDVARVLVGLMRKGLIVITQYGAILGEIANDDFKNFRLSREGVTLVDLIS